MEKLRPIVFPFMFGALVVGVLLYIAATFLQKKENFAPEEKESVDENAEVILETERWLTYRNPTYGFKVQYPSWFKRWTKENNEFASFRGKLPDSSAPLLFNVNVLTDFKYPTREAFLEASGGKEKNDELEVRKESELAISGAPSFMRVEFGEKSIYFSLYIFKEEKVYLLTLIGGEGSRQGELQALFDRIIPTVEFAEG